jgi:hypothetical protein
MRTLELDFQRPAPPSFLGWAILLAALVALAALLGVHHTLDGETRTLQAAVKRIEALVPGAAMVRAQDPTDDAALTAARRALERSKLPWSGLFAALESADSKDVALLAVTPDVARGQLKIHAEARHLAAMLAFHQRLQQAEGLQRVALVDHEVSREESKDTAEPSVRFHIVAAWGADHGRP